jgi:hypothetical protein
VSEDLKPCPFCGAGTTEVRDNGRVWAGTRYSTPSSVSVRHWCEPVEGQPTRMVERVGRDRESAVAAWNLRAPLVSFEPREYQKQVLDWAVNNPLIVKPKGAQA